MIRLLKLALALALLAGEASAFIREIVVTPSFLKTEEVPLVFSVVERSADLFSIMVTIPAPSVRFGKAYGYAAAIYISASDLPPFDPKNQGAWVESVIGAKNLAREIALTVPKPNGADVSRFLILRRRDVARAVIRVHFKKPGYGGDVYVIPLAYFLPEKANQSSEPTH